MTSLQERLSAGLAGLGIAPEQAPQKRMLEYLALLNKWNKVYNLTAVRDPQKMLYQHLLDSLAVLPHIEGHRLLDIGSGAGLPGIPLGLSRPDIEVTLLDSNHKKAAFLQQAVIELDLKNVTVVCERGEAWQPPQLFDSVISRAFSDLPEFVRIAGRLCRSGGVLLGMKGVYPYEELELLPQSISLERVIPLNVPGLEAQRHLVVMRAS